MIAEADAAFAISNFTCAALVVGLVKYPAPAHVRLIVMGVAKGDLLRKFVTPIKCGVPRFTAFLG